MSYQQRMRQSNYSNGISWTTTSIILGVIMLLICIFVNVKSKYVLERDIFSEWTLADRSSSIEAKQKHISNFVENLEINKSDFASHNAVFLKTDMNSFLKNLEALRTLNVRLEEIKSMDSKSFEYQTAMQQITAQEQGEAHELLSVISGCWLLDNYVLAWDWIGGVAFFGSVFLIGIGLFFKDL